MTDQALRKPLARHAEGLGSPLLAGLPSFGRAPFKLDQLGQGKSPAIQGFWVSKHGEFLLWRQGLDDAVASSDFNLGPLRCKRALESTHLAPQILNLGRISPVETEVRKVGAIFVEVDEDGQRPVALDALPFCDITNDARIEDLIDLRGRQNTILEEKQGQVDGGRGGAEDDTNFRLGPSGEPFFKRIVDGPPHSPVIRRVWAIEGDRHHVFGQQVRNVLGKQLLARPDASTQIVVEDKGQENTLRKPVAQLGNHGEDRSSQVFGLRPSLYQRGRITQARRNDENPFDDPTHIPYTNRCKMNRMFAELAPLCKIGRYRVQFSVAKRLRTHDFNGAMVRGAFGTALHTLHGGRGAYESLFEPQVEEGSRLRPYRLRDVSGERMLMEPGTLFEFGLDLLGTGNEYLTEVAQALAWMGFTGLGTERSPLQARTLWQELPDGGRHVLWAGIGPPKPPVPTTLADYPMPIGGRYLLSLKSPTVFRVDGRLVPPTLPLLCEGATRRMARLAGLDVSHRPHSRVEGSPTWLEERTFGRCSRREGDQAMKGWVGAFEVRVSSPLDAAPLWAACLLGIGRHTTFGFGEVELDPLEPDLPGPARSNEAELMETVR